MTPSWNIYFPFLSAYDKSQTFSPLKNKNWAAPSFAYILAGSGVVFENYQESMVHRHSDAHQTKLKTCEVCLATFASLKGKKTHYKNIAPKKN